MTKRNRLNSGARRLAARQRGRVLERLAVAVAERNTPRIRAAMKSYRVLVRRHSGHGLVRQSAAMRGVYERFPLAHGPARVEGLRSEFGPLVSWLVEEGILARSEARLLSSVNPRTVLGLQSAVRTYSKLAAELPVAKMMSEVARKRPQEFAIASRVSDSVTSSHGDRGHSPIRFGAVAPRRESVRASFNADPSRMPPIGKRVGGCSAILHDDPAKWSVRSQGDRGTCVAFATTACFEYVEGLVAQRSPQFAYWRLKSDHADPFPGRAGSTLGFAHRLARDRGHCAESRWAYNPAVIAGNESHGGVPVGQPVAGCHAEARRYRREVRYAAPTARRAEQLCRWLQAGPVAVSLPVFSDANGMNAWTSGEAWRYGSVQDPPAKGIAELSGGHAVCIVGYVPDPDDSGGGAFIFRNSWGTEWGSELPTVDPVYRDVYVSPRPGFGQVSAGYIDTYLWEMFQPVGA